jgi:hypothetical protein
MISYNPTETHYLHHWPVHTCYQESHSRHTIQ